MSFFKNRIRSEESCLRFSASCLSCLVGETKVSCVHPTDWAEPLWLLRADVPGRGKLPRLYRPWACAVGSGVFNVRLRGTNVKPTTHMHLVPRYGISGGVLPLPHASLWRVGYRQSSLSHQSVTDFLSRVVCGEFEW